MAAQHELIEDYSAFVLDLLEVSFELLHDLNGRRIQAQEKRRGEFVDSERSKARKNLVNERGSTVPNGTVEPGSDGTANEQDSVDGLARTSGASATSDGITTGALTASEDGTSVAGEARDGGFVVVRPASESKPERLAPQELVDIQAVASTDELNNVRFSQVHLGDELDGRYFGHIGQRVKVAERIAEAYGRGILKLEVLGENGAVEDTFDVHADADKNLGNVMSRDVSSIAQHFEITDEVRFDTAGFGVYASYLHGIPAQVLQVQQLGEHLGSVQATVMVRDEEAGEFVTGTLQGYQGAAGEAESGTLVLVEAGSGDVRNVEVDAAQRVAVLINDPLNAQVRPWVSTEVWEEYALADQELKLSLNEAGFWAGLNYDREHRSSIGHNFRSDSWDSMINVVRRPDFVAESAEEWSQYARIESDGTHLGYLDMTNQAVTIMGPEGEQQLVEVYGRHFVIDETTAGLKATPLSLEEGKQWLRDAGWKVVTVSDAQIDTDQPVYVRGATDVHLSDKVQDVVVSGSDVHLTGEDTKADIAGFGSVNDFDFSYWGAEVPAGRDSSPTVEPAQFSFDAPGQQMQTDEPGWS